LLISDGQEMFCHYRRFAPATKPAGQDVFPEYRRHARNTWSGSARHPGVCYSFAIYLLPKRPSGLPVATHLLSDCYHSLFAFHHQGTLAMYTSPSRKGAPSESRSSLHAARLR